MGTHRAAALVDEALEHFRAGRIDAADAAAARAVALDPGCAAAQGRAEEGLAELLRAVEAAPGLAAARDALLLNLHYADRLSPDDVAGLHRRFGPPPGAVPSPARPRSIRTRGARCGSASSRRTCGGTPSPRSPVRSSRPPTAGAGPSTRASRAPTGSPRGCAPSATAGGTSPPPTTTRPRR